MHDTNPRIVEVVPLADYRLLLTFGSGDRRVFDMRPYLDKGVFAELKTPGLFNTVRVCFDTIEWSNGADLCPEVLYSQSVPVEECEAALPDGTTAR
jgi:hypothetical protein